MSRQLVFLSSEISPDNDFLSILDIHSVPECAGDFPSAQIIDLRRLGIGIRAMNLIYAHWQLEELPRVEVEQGCPGA